MHITLEQARTLDSIARLGSISEAAKDLKKGHSAIIYSLKTMEEITGVNLLDRSTYRTSLTDTGKAVWELCKKILQTEAQLFEVCKNSKNNWEPYLKIIYDGLLPIAPILQSTLQVRKESPHTQISLFTEYLSGVTKKYNEEKADVYISILPIKTDNFLSTRIKLPPLTATLVAHKDHFLSQKKGKHTLNDLKEQTFLTVRGSDEQLQLSTKELEKKSTFHLSDFNSKKYALLEKVGFGWMPKHLIKEELKSKTLVPIRWDGKSTHNFKVSIYYTKSNRLGNAAKTFIEHYQSLSISKSKI